MRRQNISNDQSLIQNNNNQQNKNRIIASYVIKSKPNIITYIAIIKEMILNYHEILFVFTQNGISIIQSHELTKDLDKPRYLIHLERAMFSVAYNEEGIILGVLNLKNGLPRLAAFKHEASELCINLQLGADWTPQDRYYRFECKMLLPRGRSIIQNEISREYIDKEIKDIAQYYLHIKQTKTLLLSMKNNIIERSLKPYKSTEMKFALDEEYIMITSGMDETSRTIISKDALIQYNYGQFKSNFGPKIQIEFPSRVLFRYASNCKKADQETTLFIGNKIKDGSRISCYCGLKYEKLIFTCKFPLWVSELKVERPISQLRSKPIQLNQINTESNQLRTPNLKHKVPNTSVIESSNGTSNRTITTTIPQTSIQEKNPPNPLHQPGMMRKTKRDDRMDQNSEELVQMENERLKKVRLANEEIVHQSFDQRKDIKRIPIANANAFHQNKSRNDQNPLAIPSINKTTANIKTEFLDNEDGGSRGPNHNSNAISNSTNFGIISSQSNNNNMRITGVTTGMPGVIHKNLIPIHNISMFGNAEDTNSRNMMINSTSIPLSFVNQSSKRGEFLKYESGAKLNFTMESSTPDIRINPNIKGNPIEVKIDSNTILTNKIGIESGKSNKTLQSNGPIPSTRGNLNSVNQIKKANKIVFEIDEKDVTFQEIGSELSNLYVLLTVFILPIK